jgi:uroporphyrinogen-III synthase
MSVPTFSGATVLALESRRAKEMAALITTHGGVAVVAPSMREVPLESNIDALAFADGLERGDFDIVVLLTGVGTRLLLDVVARGRGRRQAFIDALGRHRIAVRGPKPHGVLRELGIAPWAVAPEPNTWRELLAAVQSAAAPGGLSGRHLAVQEYGVPSPELVAGLEALGARVTRVPVYQWALPEDLAPLENACLALAASTIDVVLLTAATQVVHLRLVAERMGVASGVRQGLARALVCSIGPTTSQELARAGVTVGLEPSHPKMGLLVREAATRYAERVVEQGGA